MQKWDTLKTSRMKKNLFPAKVFRDDFNEIRSGSLSATSLALTMHLVTQLEGSQYYYA